MLRKIVTAAAFTVAMALPAVAQDTGVEEEMQMIAKAVAGLHEKAAAGNGKAAFYLSSFYHVGMFVSPDREKAIAYLKDAAEAGDPDGQYYLGLHYINGVDMARDVERGTALISAAADAGHPAGKIAMDVYLSD